MPLHSPSGPQKPLLVPPPQPPLDPDGIIDMDILGQVFEMDEGMGDEDEAEDEAPEPFSKGIVWNYFEQAEETFGSMMQAL